MPRKPQSDRPTFDALRLVTQGTIMVTLEEVLVALARRERLECPEGDARRALCEAVAVYMVATNPTRFKKEIADVAVERAELRKRIEAGRAK